MSTITLRSVKGSGLTNNEIDTNFTNLNTDKIEATQTVTLTNKTLALGGNTISGTTAQFNTALTDGDFATLAGTETLTNKTLTSPAINGGVIDTTSTTATAALGTSSTRLANTAFVQQEKEYLPALSQSLHIGAVVKAIVYDTSKDSDGGAWRKRCADKSWYTETLGGDRWIGQHATISAAWTAAGSTTGAVYQASATAGAQTIGNYYTPTSSTTATEVFRGVSREFPAVVGVVAESARVVIYDLSAVGCPMWMVFASTSGYALHSGTPVLSIAAGQGQLVIGLSNLIEINFLSDSSTLRYVSNYFRRSLPIGSRNTAGTWSQIDTSKGIVNGTSNDVALTVLDSSPIDPATGLPVPTIAVATAGGVSVIKDDGTVVNSAVSTMVANVCFSKDGRLRYGSFVGVAYGFRAVRVSDISAGFSGDASLIGGAGSVPALPYSDYIASGGDYVLTRGAGDYPVCVLKENPSTPAKGMVNYLTHLYTSGWQVGDIRGAYLADTTAETITASGELVTNGTFTTDTTGWTTYQNGVLSVDTARLLITNGAADSGAAYQTITTVADKTYVFSITITEGTSATSIVRVGAGSGAAVSSYVNATNLGDGVFTYTFTATSTTTTITVYVGTITLGHTVYFDNISVKLAEPDRSVKNKGLVINGSLTKTAVASGAGLVAYSGFSGSNYLEQPYNSDLDFGTGDCLIFAGWLNPPNLSSGFCMLHRSLAATAGGIVVQAAVTTGYIQVYGSATSGFSLLLTSTVGITVNSWNYVEVGRLSGTLYVRINGVVVGSVADSTNLTYANTVTRIGQRNDSSTPLIGSIALVRIGATMTTLDQSAHIYRTELPLFQASAQCTLAGSSTAVTALAYDDTSDILHVGTSWGRSGFRDLLRIDSEATTNGAITSLSAKQGAVLTGGATAGSFYLPAMLLRDELRRKDEARKALGKVPVFFDYTATASQTAFVLPKGYTAKAVYHNGTLKRETTTGVYWTRSTDGFAETCTLSAGATVSDWISVMATRNY